MTSSGRTLLVDNQLPPALARHLDALGYPSLHVVDLGLADADDRAIWAHAKAREWVIVTKDEDFQDLSIRLGSPPQVLWVRLGNCRKQSLFKHSTGSSNPSTPPCDRAKPSWNCATDANPSLDGCEAQRGAHRA